MVAADRRYKPRYAFPGVPAPLDSREHDLETGIPLLDQGGNLVQMLEGSQTTADAEWVAGPSPGDRQALAVQPTTLEVVVPDGYQPGQTLRVKGPHGALEVSGPVNAAPGNVLNYRLGPDPDFRVTVPLGLKDGAKLQFERADGVRIAVPVPKGMGPGDSFEIRPPALMVRVPEGAQAGDVVVFRDEAGPADAGWIRARVPAEQRLGYFAVRVPEPKATRRR